MAAEYEPLPPPGEWPAPDRRDLPINRRDSEVLAIWDRVAKAQELIAGGYTDGEIRRALCEADPDCDIGKANRAMRLARQDWARGANRLDREARFNQGEAMLLATFRAARERKKAMQQGAGIGLQQTVYVDDMDTSTMGKMVGEYLRMHRLVQPDATPANGETLIVNVLNVIQQQLGQTSALPATTGEPVIVEAPEE